MMKKLLSFVMMMAMTLTLGSCGGDNATPDSGGIGGGDTPIGTSSVGAWYLTAGSYLLVWDFANNSTVTLHLYEISGDVYYKTSASGSYTKSGDALTMTIAGDKSTATIVGDVMHMEDPDLGSIQLKKVDSAMQSSLTTMEQYFDRTQQEAIGDWYMESNGDIYVIITFESGGKGKLVVYSGSTTGEQQFTWARGNNIHYSSDYSDKFNIRNGVLTLIETERSSNTTYTMVFARMTDEIWQKIEDLQDVRKINGSYVSKNISLGEKGFSYLYTDEGYWGNLYVFDEEGKTAYDNVKYCSFSRNTSGQIVANVSGADYPVTVNGDGSEVTIDGVAYVKKEHILDDVTEGKYIEKNYNSNDYYTMHIIDGKPIISHHFLSSGKMHESVDVAYIQLGGYAVYWGGGFVFDYDTSTTGWLYYNNDGNTLTIGTKQFVKQSSLPDSTPWNLLCGNSSKTWTWNYGTKVSWHGGDYSTAPVWGNMGYCGGSGKDVALEGEGRWWGCVSEDDFKEQLANTDDGVYHGDGSPNATMEFSYDGTITTRDGNGNVIRRGNFTVGWFNDEDANAWRVGYLWNAQGAILWPFEINAKDYGDPVMPSEFEIVYLTDDRMTLVVPCTKAKEGGLGSWSEATYWQFKRK